MMYHYDCTFPGELSRVLNLGKMCYRPTISHGKGSEAVSKIYTPGHGYEDGVMLTASLWRQNGGNFLVAGLNFQGP